MSFPRNPTLYAAGLGVILAQRGQLDEAISVTTEAIQGVRAGWSSGRSLAGLRRTVDLLGQQKYPPATPADCSPRSDVSVEDFPSAVAGCQS